MSSRPQIPDFPTGAEGPGVGSRRPQTANTSPASTRFSHQSGRTSKRTGSIAGEKVPEFARDSAPARSAQFAPRDPTPGPSAPVGKSCIGDRKSSVGDRNTEHRRLRSHTPAVGTAPKARPHSRHLRPHLPRKVGKRLGDVVVLAHHHFP